MAVAPPLREINARQIAGEATRRWFVGEDMDLVVWFDRDGSIVGFQLAYDESGLERAVTWKLGSGFRHERVDDGEGRPGRHKAAPILLADGDFSASATAARFTACAAGIDHRIADFVYAKLLEFPGQAGRT